MKLEELRRVVTGHDPEGNAIVKVDETVRNVASKDGCSGARGSVVANRLRRPITPTSGPELQETVETILTQPPEVVDALKKITGDFLY